MYVGDTFLQKKEEQKRKENRKSNAVALNYQWAA